MKGIVRNGAMQDFGCMPRGNDEEVKYSASLSHGRQGGDSYAKIQHIQLRAAALKVLERLVTPGTYCALIVFSLHRNVGDSAIWSGERALLRQSRVSMEYVCDHQSFSDRDLLDRLSSGTIMISGGGNLGDLWPTSQQFRERIIAGFPHIGSYILRSRSTSRMA